MVKLVRAVVISYAVGKRIYKYTGMAFTVYIPPS